MKNFATFLLILSGLLSNLQSLSQSKADYNWFFSVHNGALLPIKDGNILSFKDGRSLDSIYSPILSGGSNNSYSDQNGDLLFYSNGCHMMNKNHEFMEGGETLNFGDAWQAWCGEEAGLGYPIGPHALIIPDPANNDGYYYIHMNIDYTNTDVVLRRIMYSYVSFEQNELGEVSEKNQTIVQTDDFHYKGINACKHSNGKDWWILMQQNHTNTWYKILISDQGVTPVDTFQFGEANLIDGASGSTEYSPDGSLFVHYGMNEGLKIYDFDRATGDISNLRQFTPLDTFAVFSDVAFSPSGRFLYLQNPNTIYQLDLEADDLIESAVLIAEYDFERYNQTDYRYQGLQNGPDCRIYSTTVANTEYLHYINKPDEKGLACDFRFRGVELFYRNSLRSLPHFPHYRMDEEDFCNPLLTSIVDLGVPQDAGLFVFPNPASDNVNIRGATGKIGVYDQVGQLLFTASEKLLDVSGMANGVYFLRDDAGSVTRFLKM